MPVIFSGTTPATSGYGLAKQRDISEHLAAHKTIPDCLGQRGYSTAAFTPNPFTSRRFSYDGEWDYFEDYLDARSTVGRIRSAIVRRWLDGEFVAGLRFFLNMVGEGDITMRWEDILPDIVETVERLPEPFFIWVFLLEPHWPYLPTPSNRSVSRVTQWTQNWRAGNINDRTPDNVDALKSLYRGTIRDVDDFVDRITSEFSEYDPTFILHGDHGEAFGDHGHFGHKPVLYEENIHVPWVIWGDGLPQERISEPASLRKLPQLLATLADGDPSFASYTSPVAYSHSDDDHAVAHAGRWKLYSRPEDGVRAFDLENDARERSPIRIHGDISSVSRQPLVHRNEITRITSASREISTEDLTTQ
jgi:arylsulfatase